METPDIVQKIQNRCKKSKIISICSLVGMVIGFVLAFTIHMAFMVVYVVCVYTTIIAFCRFLGARRAWKFIEKENLQELCSGISVDQPTFKKSGICVGEKAIFLKKNKILIPYNKMLWLYVRTQSLYGIPVYSGIVIVTTNGKKFEVQAKVKEAQAFVLHCKDLFPPYLIIGYGREQKKAFKKLKSQFKTSE